jgi:hypothetical protein
VTQNKTIDEPGIEDEKSRNIIIFFARVLLFCLICRDGLTSYNWSWAKKVIKNNSTGFVLIRIDRYLSNP